MLEARLLQSHHLHHPHRLVKMPESDWRDKVHRHKQVLSETAATFLQDGSPFDVPWTLKELCDPHPRLSSRLHTWDFFIEGIDWEPSVQSRFVEFRTVPFSVFIIID
jgi:hypothetical protein